MLLARTIPRLSKMRNIVVAETSLDAFPRSNYALGAEHESPAWVKSGSGAGGKTMKLSLFVGAALAPLILAVATPAAAGPVTGTVADGSGTRTLQGAEVTIVELGQTATVGADGSFRFGDVPAGAYTLRARFAGAVEGVRGAKTDFMSLKNAFHVAAKISCRRENDFMSPQKFHVAET